MGRAEELQQILAEEESSEDAEMAEPTPDINLELEDYQVLKLLSQKQLIEIIDKLAAAEGSDVGGKIKTVAGGLMQQINKAEEEQYQTISHVEADAGLPAQVPESVEAMQHMAKYTPLRLSYPERAGLRLLEAAMEVSEYTDKVDIYHVGQSRARRINTEIRQLCAVLCGLVIAQNYDEGKRLMQESNFQQNKLFFQSVFEIGRRYKILNPERMRGSYGKLMYLLMDARKTHIHEMLEFDAVVKIKTVGDLLSRREGGLELLTDPLLPVAIREIMPEAKSRDQIQAEIGQKERARAQLIRKYAVRGTKRKAATRGGFLGISSWLWGGSSKDESEDEEKLASIQKNGLSRDDVELALHSLGDHNAFWNFSRLPTDKMIEYLKSYFKQDSHEHNLSLGITAGLRGSRLTHPHHRQFLYVLQSLTLWREIQHEMLYLWSCAEDDLLDSRVSYSLQDTGQGLHRVQDAPRTRRTMNKIIGKVQSKVGGWIGSSAVHLGDHNVPNAFLFIDKYTQIPLILGPLVTCLDKLPPLYQSSSKIRAYIDSSFGGKEELIKTILCDFFRHAFDGSGADNFFDAGSCIDGRLTSAWNWCSKIEKKPYFPVMLLTGFTGFDGSFK